MSGTTVFGVASLSFMMVMYVLEHRDPRYIPGFALSNTGLEEEHLLEVFDGLDA